MSQKKCQSLSAQFFAQTNIIDGHMKRKPSFRSVCCLALEKYAPQSNFSCEKYMSLSRKRIIHLLPTHITRISRDS